MSDTPTLASQFDQDGFVTIPNLFSRAEVAEIKREIQRVLEEVKTEKIQEGQSPEKALRTGVYVGLAGRSAFFRHLVADERLLDVLEVIMGANIEFLSDKVVFKNFKTDFPSPWHQDWPYWHGSHKLSVWVALDDAGADNGCLKLLSGSHKQVAIHDGDASDDLGFNNRLKVGAVDESQAFTAEIEAGGAVFFHDLTLHASHPNTTRRDRWVWLPTYRDSLADDPEYDFAVAARVIRGELF